MTYRQKETGQSLLIVALGLTVLIGALGLGVDMGFYRYEKRQLQTAADSAALAGAQAYGKGTAYVNPAANQALNSNGYGSSSGTAIAINNPPTCTTSAPCNLPAADPNNGLPNFVEVVLTKNEPTFFSKIFGVTSVPLTARAEAEANQNCIYTLNQSGTGIAIGFAFVTTDCGVVDESSGNSAMTCTIGFLNAPSIEIVGKFSSLLCFNLAPPRTGITLPSKPYDPMFYLQSSEPVVTPCGATLGGNVWAGAPGPGALTINAANSPATLESGVYCGGISLQAGANVTFGNPGSPGSPTTIVMTGAANGLNFGPATNVTTQSGGVTFYNNTGPINFTFTSVTFGAINLFASTSGPLKGVLFFQPPTNTSASTVFGSFNFNQHINGGYYMPGASLTYAFDFVTDSANSYSPIVVYSLNFFLSGFTSVSAFTKHAPTGLSPLASQNAVLVQ
jgi:Flp pilus assembly protein TadG